MLILIPFSSFPANRTIDKYGAAFSIRIGCVLTVIGAWSRMLVIKDFSLLIISSFFAGIGGAFIFNANGRVGVSWFDPRNIVRVFKKNNLQIKKTKYLL